MGKIDKDYAWALDSLIEWRLNMDAQYPELFIETSYIFKVRLLELVWWRLSKLKEHYSQTA